MKFIISSIVLFTIFSACSNSNNNNNSNTKTSNATKATDTETKAINNNELKAYMIAGIYTISGFGGINAVNETLGNKPSINDYVNKLAFPFEKNQEGIKETLASMWNINNSANLLKRNNELLNDDKSKFKAWDYARLVNNVHMGYAAGYITKEEGKKIIQQVLPKAKANFKTWDDFFANFLEGRKNWNAADENTQEFEKAVAELQQSDLYKNNPLN